MNLKVFFVSSFHPYCIIKVPFVLVLGCLRLAELVQSSLAKLLNGMQMRLLFYTVYAVVFIFIYAFTF